MGHEVTACPVSALQIAGGGGRGGGGIPHLQETAVDLEKLEIQPCLTGSCILESLLRILASGCVANLACSC